MIDQWIFNNKKVAFHTLGCKLNFAETSALGKQMCDEGFVKAKKGEQADVCIINTCSVTDIADRKCRQAISKMNRLHPNSLMIVTGCYAQLKPNEIAAIEGVDLVLGTNEKFSILDFIHKKDSQKTVEIHRSTIQQMVAFQPSCSQEDRTRAFLKIQDGCDYYCSYCTIPFARGKSRSGSIQQTVTMAEEAIHHGAKEIVLTGVNIGDFGRGTNESFIQLIRALDQLTYDVRFRISSIEPNLLSDEIIRFVAQSQRFMPHFHIPLQSGNNTVLSLMKRKYTRELFAQKVATIRNVLPQAFIGVDVIVGVHGETIEFFEDSLAFIEALPVSQLHVFTYSERDATKMLELSHRNSLQERKRRSDILHNLSDQKLREFYTQHQNSPYPVLWESSSKGEQMVGFTSNYIKTEKPFQKNLINTVEIVCLGNFNEEGNALQAMTNVSLEE